jgi:uncharacterized protein with FMN-binding domain
VKRMMASTAATVAGLALLIGAKQHAGRTAGTAGGPISGTTGSGSTGSPSTGPAPSTQPTTGPAPSPKPSTGSTRMITGKSVSTRYGDVEVQVTMSGLRITNLTPLKLPDSNGVDLAIDQQVVPMLIQETLQAQSAQIDMISGATYTSDGYIRSLQSALDKAKA